MSAVRIVGFIVALRRSRAKIGATLRITPRLAYRWTDFPANVCQTSGGSLRWSRFASSTIALEPAPPATAPLIALTPGFGRRKAANKSLRAAASDREVHHDTTSSCFVAVAGLVGDWLPHALTTAAAAAAAIVTRQRPLTPRPRRVAAGSRRSPEQHPGLVARPSRSARPWGRTAARDRAARSTTPERGTRQPGWAHP